MDKRQRGLEEEREALVSAASDMREAAAGARHIAEGIEMNSDAKRALETGVVTCYRRPFSDSKDPSHRLDRKKWAPKDPTERSAHFNLLHLRDNPWRVFAYSDADSRMRNAWIAKVAEDQATRMKQRLEEIEDELAG